MEKSKLEDNPEYKVNTWVTEVLEFLFKSEDKRNIIPSLKLFVIQI